MTKTRITALLILALLCLLLAACSGKKQPISTEDGKGALITNDAIDFFFYYPSGWKIDRNLAMLSVYYDDFTVTEPGAEGGASLLVRPNISATAMRLETDQLGNPIYATPGEYFDKQFLPMLRSIADNVTLAGATVEAQTETAASEAETITSGTEAASDGAQEAGFQLGGVPAVRRDYTAVIMGKEYSFTQIMAINRGNIYTLTYTSVPENHGKYMDALDTAVKDFAFK